MNDGNLPAGPEHGMAGPVAGTGISLLMLGASLMPQLKDWLQVSALCVSIGAGLVTIYAAWKRRKGN